MPKINFTKMVASGNDFIIIEPKEKRINFANLAKQLCNRKFGIGADGLLILSKTKRADVNPVRGRTPTASDGCPVRSKASKRDGCLRQPASNGVKMRIFNSDGSEAEMCGNGARCAAFYYARNQKPALRLRSGLALSKVEVPVTSYQIRIETKAGVLKAQVEDDNVKINMTEPKNIDLGLQIKINGRTLRANFINTGVPHTVILCEGIEKINVHSLGRLIRFHKKFKPQGTNVNFIEPKELNSLKIRTYERGVEEETLACGTGSTAAAIIYALKLKNAGLAKEDKFDINVSTLSGEILKVHFEVIKNKIKDVWLEGKARIVFTGEL